MWASVFQAWSRIAKKAMFIFFSFSRYTCTICHLQCIAYWFFSPRAPSISQALIRQHMSHREKHIRMLMARSLDPGRLVRAQDCVAAYCVHCHIFIKPGGDINLDGLRGQKGAGEAEERGKSEDEGIRMGRVVESEEETSLCWVDPSCALLLL